MRWFFCLLLLCGAAHAQTMGQSGGSSSLVIGTTPITGGATTQVLFNLAGVVTSDSGLTYAGSSGAVSIAKIGTQSAPSLLFTAGGASTNTGFAGTTTPSITVGVNGGLVADFAAATISLYQKIDLAGGGPYIQYGGSQNPATIQQGLNAASPVAQVYQGAGARAGTDTNAAGGNFTIRPGAGTGTGTPSQLIFQNPAVAGSGSGAQTQTTAMTISGAQLVSLPAISTDSGQTATATVCEDTTTHALYFGSGAAGICKGTSSIRFKHDILPLEAGIEEILRLGTVSYYLNEGYGDSSRKLYGFTAEQMYEVLPELVWVGKDGRPDSIDWAGLVPVLVNAIKWQQAEIDDLKKAAGK